MTYAEFRARRHFHAAELLAFGRGELVSEAPAGFAARLPLPPMLMIDRITEIDCAGARGRVVGERDVHPDDWFFRCHFADDPVQPGCLGVDAVWQLLGFFCAWRGGLGAGRALGCRDVDFEGQIGPSHRVVRYELDVRRCTILPDSGATLAVGDAIVRVDGEPIYTLRAARAGLFRDLNVAGALGVAR
jgi:3-hydroxyacyl-[acyl-carrier protein] dehydratase/trans-2-decenoyl-[acyl-carrier protein] isomerase